MKNKLLPLAACLFLAACTLPPQDPSAGPAIKAMPVYGDSLEELLAYNALLRKMPAPELARELQRLHGFPASPSNRVRKAMVLAMTRDPIDLTKAEAQLWNVMADNSVEAEKLKPLVQLLVGNYADQRRLADNAERSSNQAREAQRKVEELRDKLEALKNIERSLPATGK